MFFADDGLVLARNVIEMRELIELLSMAALDIGLKINKGKSNMMIVGGNSECTQVSGINVESEIKYLGLDISEKKDIFKNYKEKKIGAAQRMSNMTFSVIARSCNRLLLGKSFWKSIVLPNILYGNAIVTWKKEELRRLQVQENAVWRKILGAPSYASVAALRGEIGTSTMLARDMKGKLKFVKHLLEGKNELAKQALENNLERKTDEWSKQVLGNMNEAFAD